MDFTPFSLGEKGLNHGAVSACCGICGDIADAMYRFDLTETDTGSSANEDYSRCKVGPPVLSGLIKPINYGLVP